MSPHAYYMQEKAGQPGCKMSRRYSNVRNISGRVGIVAKRIRSGRHFNRGIANQRWPQALGGQLTQMRAALRARKRPALMMHARACAEGRSRARPSRDMSFSGGRGAPELRHREQQLPSDTALVRTGAADGSACRLVSCAKRCGAAKGGVESKLVQQNSSPPLRHHSRQGPGTRARVVRWAAALGRVPTRCAAPPTPGHDPSANSETGFVCFCAAARGLADAGIAGWRGAACGQGLRAGREAAAAREQSWRPAQQASYERTSGRPPPRPWQDSSPRGVQTTRLRRGSNGGAGLGGELV
jgi:hypothetical protein